MKWLRLASPVMTSNSARYRLRSAMIFSAVMSCFMPKMRHGTPSTLSTVAVIRIQRRLPFTVTISVSRLNPVRSAMARLRRLVSSLTESSG